MLKCAVPDDEVAHASGGFAADRRSVPVLEQTIGNRDVFAGEFPARKLATRFDGDVVVADIDAAMGDTDAPTHARVDAVRVRRTSGSEDSNSVDGDVLALN